ncbi:hypothetical protein MBLNU13_g02642t2 [Cladosporium sp. NU13]
MATTRSSITTNSAGDPGLSLWLVPLEDSHAYNVLTKAITSIVPDEMGASGSAPKFEPHITLASRIPRQAVTSDPQKWLDEIDLPTISTVEVRWHELAVGDKFHKKLFIRCKRTDSLLQLALSCRAFSSATIDAAHSKDGVSEDEKRRIEGKLAEPNMVAIGESERGWEGGSIWLVPTDVDVVEWQPIARRS